MAALSKEAREAQRQYQKNWRDNHPERCKQYRLNYWEKVARQQSKREEQES